MNDHILVVSINNRFTRHKSTVDRYTPLVYKPFISFIHIPPFLQSKSFQSGIKIYVLKISKVQNY